MTQFKTGSVLYCNGFSDGIAAKVIVDANSFPRMHRIDNRKVGENSAEDRRAGEVKLRRTAKLQ